MPTSLVLGGDDREVVHLQVDHHSAASSMVVSTLMARPSLDITSPDVAWLKNDLRR
jgi:hypothetical protein